MPKKASAQRQSITALKVPQWMNEWEKVHFNDKCFQSRPKEHFYLLSLPASVLKSLTGVYHRTAKPGVPRALDPNVQRGHQSDRSKTIQEFVQHGFPWCEMSGAQKLAPDAHLLRKPGWLPTAIVINILGPNDVRNHKTIAETDLISVDDSGQTSQLYLPESFTAKEWEPSTIFPMEVIDGQHRLWAFSGFDPGADFHLPVVAFHGLDRSWQAYLFWSINITPKRINPSLAYDLYPLLRQEDWLERFSGHAIYRESRCQELVEALWAHPDSPWRDRINMLGERGTGIPMVTQSAWIRSLFNSFVKKWGEEESTRIGGLFGVGDQPDELKLPWSRPMQAAYLIYAGSKLRDEIASTKAPWAAYLREQEDATLFDSEKGDAAFAGRYSLLSTDQGIRGWLQVTNDLSYVTAKQLELEDWNWEDIDASTRNTPIAATDGKSVSRAISHLAKTKAGEFLQQLAKAMATYDWRSSSTPRLEPDLRLQKAAFRGSGGYKELRHQLLLHLSHAKAPIGTAATTTLARLGYSR